MSLARRREEGSRDEILKRCFGLGKDEERER